MNSVNNSIQNKNLTINILVCGNSYVGKTSLIESLCSNQFLECQTPTIGVDFRQIKHQINGHNINIKFIDCPGQNRHQDLILSACRNLDGVVYVYDITDQDSFYEINGWYNHIKTNFKDTLFSVLIGNKCDKSQIRQISLEKGMKYAMEKNIQFFETSAKSGKDVNNAIMALVNKIFCSNEFQNKLNSQNIDQGQRSISLTNTRENNYKYYFIKRQKQCCDL